MDFINAIILLLNYIFVPALTYGSQLALGAIFVTLIYGILRFANFATGDMMAFGTMVTILFTWYFQSLGYFFRCFANSSSCYTICYNFYDWLHALHR
jgi:branched-chain amino acid transport system permease protein